MIIQVCVGSSCHLKGSADIVELFQNTIQEHGLEGEITLAGSFCIGKCNRIGVTVQIDDDVHTGVTRENFKEFFTEKVLKVFQDEGKN
ncbi:MAG: (2Fe-2S) ferredoxin domain-containing protein [Oscillospiraceae bacterium]|nr:(2Fe-2S) ferredoxin domain-containing protein [Oscillospiraceae bacterium]MBQ8904470.1 (2Fe-2S) ferredoxin domain-containing protein [Oscillospiraceae bacterium]